MPENQQALGFYYCLFQSQIGRDYVKCWIDGEEYSTLIHIDEFLSLVREAEPSLLPNFRRALQETSYFFWDTSNHLLKRMHARFELEPYKEAIAKKIEEQEEESLLAGNPIVEKYFRRNTRNIDTNPQIQTGI